MQKANQNVVIAQVVKFLNEQGYCAFRVENNGRIDKQALITQLLKLFEALALVNYSDEQKAKLFGAAIDKCYRPVPGAMKGVSDVVGFHAVRGTWISVEIKVGNDQMRPEQEVFAAKVRQTKEGEYWLCRDINSLKQGWMRKHQPQQQAV
jgi:hypothetical protein